MRPSLLKWRGHGKVDRWQPRLTILAPILINISRRLVMDRPWTGSGGRQRAQDVAEVAGERVRVETHRVAEHARRDRRHGLARSRSTR
jgi:hypothetical protein